MAGMLVSVAMLQGRLFGRATALVGLVASTRDLIHCLAFAFAPSLRVVLIAAGGLFWMIWQLLVRVRNWRSHLGFRVVVVPISRVRS